MTQAKGLLPTGWTATSTQALVGDAGIFTDGDWVLSADLKSGRDVRLLQLGDIGVGEFLDKSAKWISAARADELGVTWLLPGDILISRMAEPIARACVVPTLGYPCITAVDVAILRVDPSVVDVQFALCVFNSLQFRLQADAEAAGVTRKRISRKKLGVLWLGLPPLEEQRQIVDLVERLLRDVATGEELLKAAIRDLDDLKVARLAELAPTDAPFVRLGDVAHVFVGATPSRKDSTLWNGDVPWVSSGEVAFCRIASTRETISEAGLGNRERRLHPQGTVMLAMIGEGKTRGQAAILDVAASHNQNSAAIRLDQRRMLPEYLFYWFMREYQATRRGGSGSQQPALNKEIVSGLRVPCPPLGEQRELIRSLEQDLPRIESLRQQLTASLGDSGLLRQGIISRAVTGQLAAKADESRPLSNKQRAVLIAE